MFRVDRRHEIAAVVHRHLRLGRDDRFDVRVVRRVIFAFDRERRNAVVAERRGDVVLRRERIARAERDLRAAGLQRQHEVRRLGRDVQARADANALERFLDFEAVADLREHRHVGSRPRDARRPGFCEAAVLDVSGGLIQYGHGFKYS